MSAVGPNSIVLCSSAEAVEFATSYLPCDDMRREELEKIRNAMGESSYQDKRDICHS